MSIFTLTLNFTIPLAGYLSAYPLAFLGALASDNILPIRYLLYCSQLRLGWLLTARPAYESNRLGYFVPSDDLFRRLGGYYPPGFGLRRWSQRKLAIFRSRCLLAAAYQPDLAALV